MLFQRIKKTQDGGQVALRNRNACFGLHAQIDLRYFAALRQCIADALQGSGLRYDLRGSAIVKVDNAGKQRFFSQLVFTLVFRIDLDEAAGVKQPSNIAAFGERTTMTAKEKAELRGASVAVVGGSLYNYRYSGRSVPFVANLFNRTFTLTRRARDCPFYGVLRHVVVARFFNGHFKPVVRLRIGRTGFRRKNELLTQLCEQRTPLSVGFAFAQLDVVPF